MQGQVLQNFVIDKCDDLKAQNIIAIDVQGKSSITSYMVICTGTSTRQLVSIAEHVVQEAKLIGLNTFRVNSRAPSDWVVVDFGDVILHVMEAESRKLYELEKLWG
ncbi:ribosome silencing factor [Candidatus Erwinia dacicola]|uniref:Ribosomal silencing factor RsfS n=1 Tax=Candidatus Erwinia dacicola TaxID=252393 RepID=A0A1E7YZX1_9GAMM|nr:ribosome silencing factor [Candidatus Erwinia dacicola]OFC61905.1 ribosome silencing factor [Candidatus Erwinia dacicola]RAP71652.1 ribosomal silencing factor RsfS [Candidatus Erwinia dacicola]RAP71873.1 ribosomal silencing factor RsfS [Candidatus Erwinia dacicola]